MEVRLSKKAWHYRLQTMILGPVYFTNFCPYFWLTVFCLLFSPFYFIYAGFKALALLFLKGIVLLASGLFVLFEKPALWLSKGLSTYVCAPVENFTISNLSDAQVLRLYNDSRYYYLRTLGKENYPYLSDEERMEYALEKLLSRAHYVRAKEKQLLRSDAMFSKWIESVGPDWKKVLAAIQQREEKRTALLHKAHLRAQDAKTERETRRRQMLNKIVMYTKFVVPVLVTLASLPLALLGFVGLYGIITLPWLTILVAVGQFILDIPAGLYDLFVTLSTVFTLGEAVFIISLPFIGRTLALLSNKCNLTVPSDVVDRFGGPVVRGLNAIINNVNAFGDFCVESFKMFKKDHCPAIKWED